MFGRLNRSFRSRERGSKSSRVACGMVVCIDGTMMTVGKRKQSANLDGDATENESVVVQSCPANLTLRTWDRALPAVACCFLIMPLWYSHLRVIGLCNGWGGAIGG